MKIETYLNAMVLSRIFAKPREISTRQYHTFRDRIIRVDERNNMFIATLGATVERQKERIAELEETIRKMRGLVNGDKITQHSGCCYRR